MRSSDRITSEGHLGAPTGSVPETTPEPTQSKLAEQIAQSGTNPAQLTVQGSATHQMRLGITVPEPAPAYVHTLLDSLLCGDPIDFGTQSVPLDVQQRLACSFPPPQETSWGKVLISAREKYRNIMGVAFNDFMAEQTKYTMLLNMVRELEVGEARDLETTLDHLRAILSAREMISAIELAYGTDMATLLKIFGDDSAEQAEHAEQAEQADASEAGAEAEQTSETETEEG